MQNYVFRPIAGLPQAHNWSVKHIEEEINITNLIQFRVRTYGIGIMHIL